MKKISSYGRSLLGWLRNGFVLSRTVLFIWGLVLGHAFVKNAVVNVLADFLKIRFKFWKAAMLMNLLDGISDVLKVGVLHVSTYTGRFTVILFCTAANTLGLLLLWRIGDFLIFPMVLTALGTAWEEPTLRDFFDYQLGEEVKKKSTENSKGEDKELSEEERSEKNGSGTSNLWRSTATFSGSLIAVLCLSLISDWSWLRNLQASFCIMGATCLLFMCGFRCYYFEERRPRESPLTTIYVVFREAIKNKIRGWEYPSSEGGYYSNRKNEGSNDSEDLFYRTEKDEVHLLPRDPSFFMFLDRAAITTSNSNNAESQERNETVCTAENVRDVKRLYPMIPLGFTFFAYSLVSASGNTYFVLQGSDLDTNLDVSFGHLEVPITAFFVLKSLVDFGVRTIQSRFKRIKPIWSMAAGMSCSVLCCIAAWLVERHRLSVIRKDPNKEISILVLTPQYLLLGLMEGFAEDGLETYVRGRVPESMRTFVDPGIEMLLGIGKLSSAMIALIFRSWIKDSINTSHLDRYFLMLASLSFGFFWIYVCYAKFKLSKLEEAATNYRGTAKLKSKSGILSLVGDVIDS